MKNAELNAETCASQGGKKKTENEKRHFSERHKSRKKQLQYIPRKTSLKFFPDLCVFMAL
jgi:hypothetical protein